MTSGDDEIRRLLEEKHKLEDEHKADSPRYGDIMEQLEHKGIYELEHKAEKILAGLGFKEEDFHKPIAHLSGGWSPTSQSLLISRGEKYRSLERDPSSSARAPTITPI